MSEHKPRLGPITKRTPERARVLCSCIADGMPLRFAVSAAGISLSTYHEWRAKDGSFRQQTERALARGVQKRLAVVRDALDAQDESLRLRAATWWLEHVLPGDFAKTRLEVTGADGSPLAGAVAIVLPPKADALPVVNVPALADRSPHGNGA